MNEIIARLNNMILVLEAKQLTNKQYKIQSEIDKLKDIVNKLKLTIDN